LSLKDPRPSAGRRGRKLSPVTPGEILQEEFLRPLGISQYRLAKALTVPPRRINEIVHGKRSVTADTALRLARHFGTSERFWLNLQARYDLEIEKDRLGDRLCREVRVLVPSSWPDRSVSRPGWRRPRRSSC
jgi:antitoxin HigA-1